LSRLGLFAGAWVDRIRCLPVLVFADLGRAVLFGSIPVAALFGVLTLTQLYVVLVLTGVLTVLFDVAHSSYPPRLLQPDQLMPGNAKLAANHSVAAVLGAGAGGVLVQWLSAAVTIGVDALSFPVVRTLAPLDPYAGTTAGQAGETEPAARDRGRHALRVPAPLAAADRSEHGDDDAVPGRGWIGTLFGLHATLWIAGLASLAGTAFLYFSPFRTLRTLPAIPEQRQADPQDLPGARSD
jgi:hypothetical protein